MKKLFQFILILILFTNAVYAQLKPSVEWVKIYDGIGRSIDTPIDAKMDKEFNFYLAGRSAGVDSSQDLLILKYSRFGKLISETRYVSAPASFEEASSIAIDSSNNLYCIGSASFGTSSDFAIIQKYDSNSNLIWSKNFFNSSEHYSVGIKIIVDNDNNVIACFNGASFTKYTSSGDSLWTIHISDDTSHYAINDIITDANSNIYAAITQSYYGGSNVPNTLIHTYKFDKSGNIIWHKTFKGKYTRKILLDKTNNIVQLVDASLSGVIIKMKQNGEIELEKNSGILILTDLGVDLENNILVTGYDVTNNSFDYITRKYSASGAEVWTQIFNGEENLKDFAMALAIDKSNNIYVTGLTHNSVSLGVSYTVKYSKDGELLWQNKFDAPHSKFENSKFIFLDDSANVFIGGDVADSTNGSNFFALKIKQYLGTNIEQQRSFIAAKYSLEQNFPNPFNPTTLINYYLPRNSFIDISVYNLLGEKVTTLFNGVQEKGDHQAKFNESSLPGGIYFYVLDYGESKISKKMVLIK